MEDQELYHLGPATEGTGTSRPARSVIANLDDGVLEIAMVGGRPADLVHVTDSPPSGLK